MSSKKIRLITTICVCALLSGTALANSKFKKIAKKVLSINAMPRTHKQTTTILIMHPMIKQRETKFIHYSRLIWQGQKCQKKVIRFKKIKGVRLRGTTGVGKTYNFKYISKKLRAFCHKAKISNWQKKSGLLLESKRYHGYKFIATLNDKAKKCIIYLNSNNSLRAISFGFPQSGLSHAKNMRENAILWYFNRAGRKLRLVKTIKYTIQKKRGIPIIKKSIEIFRDR